MRKLEIDKRELEDLYIKQKLSSYECGKILHCSAFTISKNLRNFGIPVRNNSQSHKNKFYTEISKRKISEALEGIKRSEETKEKMRKSKVGTKDSEATKRKLSKAHIGQIPRNKISINERRLRELYIDKRLSLKKCGDFLGCSTTPIRRSLREFGIQVRSISEANKGQVAWNKNKRMTKEYIKNALTRRIPSSLEEKFQSIVDKYNLPYRYVGNGSFIIENYNPDFINTNNEKIAIEVYARYYKRRNKVSIEEWKEERSEVFESYGWKLFYFDETEVTEESVLSKLVTSRSIK